MKKHKVLVIYYSQSGQLKQIAENCTQSLRENNAVEVDYYCIQPKKDFPFPWTPKSFFSVFPETFLQIPIEILPPPKQIVTQKYDLVILAYQVWYLSPSIPINSFLKSDFAKKIIDNTPVITLIGCRNMWAMAQEKVKILLKQNQAKLVGNIVLRDRHYNHISVLTIVHWMFTGLKTKYLGVFPLPGVSDKDIQESTKFGTIILDALLKNDIENVQKNLLKAKAVEVKPLLISIEQKATLIFGKWANFIIKKDKKKRDFWLSCFHKYLIFAIWFVSPIVMLIYFLTLPFKIKKTKQIVSNFQNI